MPSGVLLKNILPACVLYLRYLLAEFELHMNISPHVGYIIFVQQDFSGALSFVTAVGAIMEVW